MNNPIFLRLTVQVCAECGAIYVTSDEYEGQKCNRYMTGGFSWCEGSLARLTAAQLQLNALPR